MRKIFEGVTYNTDTSTLVACKEYLEQDPPDYKDVSVKESLYKNKAGAFWLMTEGLARDGTPAYPSFVNAMTAEELHKWMASGQIDLVSDDLPEPPEAVPESAPSATIYLRAPASLKRRLEAQAKSVGQSLNAWTLASLERSLSAPAE